MKKYIILLTFFIGITALTGCGSYSSGAPQNTAPAESDGHTAEIPAPSDESNNIIESQSENEAEPMVRVPEPQDTDFVRVREYIPDIAVELMYATDRNFTGEVIYTFSDAWLRYGTVKKLMNVQDDCREKGYGLKIWDAFRPASAQFTLWAVCPDSRYVANPQNGFSSHSRGNTLDLTLVNAEGNELVMPTGFDDFTLLADRDYSDVTDETAIENAKMLEEIMVKFGFQPYFGEWWHFSDSTSYDVETDFKPEE